MYVAVLVVRYQDVRASTAMAMARYMKLICTAPIYVARSLLCRGRDKFASIPESRQVSLSVDRIWWSLHTHSVWLYRVEYIRLLRVLVARGEARDEPRSDL